MAKAPQPGPTDTLPSDGRQARLDAIRTELAAHDDVELPPEIEEWLSQLAGRFHVSFPFNADTYFDKDRELYDRDD